MYNALKPLLILLHYKHYTPRNKILYFSLFLEHARTHISFLSQAYRLQELFFSSSLADWEPDWPGIVFVEKMTLSTDLEHGVISDMAAVLWQAAEATGPVRSWGQLTVVNAEAQSEAVMLSISSQRQLQASLGIRVKSNTEVFFFFHSNYLFLRKAGS